MNKIFLTAFFCVLVSSNLFAQPAQTSTDGTAATPSANAVEQKRETSTYYNDPFSEIETSEDEEYEEAMDRFYAFGRILHLSLHGEFISVRGPMADVYKPGAMGGLTINYFIDWDVAILFGFNLGALSVSIPNVNPLISFVNPITGTATVANIEMGIKYYLNFYDISKPVAYINPAIIAGVEMTIIKDQIDQEILKKFATYNIPDASHRSIAPGLFAGMSIEIPIFRKSIYIGAEFLYHFSFFPSTNSSITAVNSLDPTYSWIDYSGHYMTYGMYLTWNL